MTLPRLIQLCPFSPELEVALARDFDVCRYFDLTDPSGWLSAHAEQVRAIATGAHIGAPGELVTQLPGLGIIAINGVGFDKVDLDLARRRDIRVTTTPDVLTDDVADFALGLTIALLRDIVPSDMDVRSGVWPQGDGTLSRKVSGKTFGILGLGKIGSAIASRLSVFGPVIYSSRTEKNVPYRYVEDVCVLADQADILIVACAATPTNANLVGADTFDALGPDGYLVNVSRGSVVDEAALIAALRDNRIAGAALDVFANEPRVPAELTAMRNVVLTPHIASATRETRQAMAELLMANLRAFVSGDPLPSILV